MRKMLVSIAALGAALAAVPAMAQSYGDRGGGYPDAQYGPPGFNHGGQGGYRPNGTSVGQVRFAVDRAIRSGQVRGREAYALRRAVDDLQRRDDRAQRDGYNWGERRDIDQRAREILQRLQYSNGGYGDRNHDGRYDDRDGRYDGGRDGGYPPPPPAGQRPY